MFGLVVSFRKDGRGPIFGSPHPVPIIRNLLTTPKNKQVFYVAIKHFCIKKIYKFYPLARHTNASQKKTGK
jgi:hypothetical protein